MNDLVSGRESVVIILASHAELSGQSPSLLSAYQRYWDVSSWDPEKLTIKWSEKVSELVASIDVSDSQLRGLALALPVKVEGLNCGCGAELRFCKRQAVLQAVRGKKAQCQACLVAQRDRKQRESDRYQKKIARLEGKAEAALRATQCDDHRPEDCVRSLDRGAATLYLEMLRLYQQEQRAPKEWLGADRYGRDMYADPSVTLSNPWDPPIDRHKYEKAGPDLYALARHRLIVPVGFIAEFIVLTHHGLMNPSRYRYINWRVEAELDGWPIVDLMGKQLRILEKDHSPAEATPQNRDTATTTHEQSPTQS